MRTIVHKYYENGDESTYTFTPSKTNGVELMDDTFCAGLTLADIDRFKEESLTEVQYRVEIAPGRFKTVLVLALD